MSAANHHWHEKLNADRTCSKCGQFKPAGEFHKRRYMCKTCEKAGYKAWVEANPEQFEKLRRRGEMKKYGITSERYDKLLASQKGCCAICGTMDTGAFKYFSVDHNHDTGKVRGLLCSRCNLVIGQARDSIQVLGHAIVYLANQ